MAMEGIQQYAVNYDINVRSEAATQNLNAFAQAVSNAKIESKKLDELASIVSQLQSNIAKLSKAELTFVVNNETVTAVTLLRQSLDRMYELSSKPIDVRVIVEPSSIEALKSLEGRLNTIRQKANINVTATNGNGSSQKGDSTAATSTAASAKNANKSQKTSNQPAATATEAAKKAYIAPSIFETIQPGKSKRMAPGRDFLPKQTSLGPRGGVRLYKPKPVKSTKLPYSSPLLAIQERDFLPTQTRIDMSQGQAVVSANNPYFSPTIQSYSPNEFIQYLNGKQGVAVQKKISSIRRARRYNAYAQNALGHAEIINPMALNMLKGVGVAYGMSAVMSGVGQVVRDATDYNNMIQTAKNILSTHDSGSDFAGRFAEMEKVVRNIGIQTKFTAPEVADAARYLAMAGLNVNDIKNAMPAVANLALVGDTDLGTTADVTTNIMTAYGIPAAEMSKAADIMTQTFTMSNTTLMEIAESYKYSASLFASAGVDMAESAGAIGVLGDAGIKASQAGTTLRTIMNNIVKPTKTQLSEWERLGIKRFKTDASGKETTEMRSLLEIFGDLNRANVPIDTYYKLFRLTAAQGAAALTNNVTKWAAITAANNDPATLGLSLRLAEEKKNTIQGLWAQLTSSFTEQGLKAFENIQSTLGDSLKKLTKLVQSSDMSAVFDDFTQRLMSYAQTIANFTKIVGGALKNFSGAYHGFLKIELLAGAIAIVARAMKSLVNVGGMVMGWGGALGGIYRKSQSWSGNIRNNAIYARNLRNSEGGAYVNFGRFNTMVNNSSFSRQWLRDYLTPEAVQNRRMDRVYLRGDNSPEYAQIINQRSQHLATYRKLLFKRQFGTIGNGIAGAALGALGAYYGSQIGGKEHPALNFLGSAALGSVGMALPGLVGGLLGTAAPTIAAYALPTVALLSGLTFLIIKAKQASQAMENLKKTAEQALKYDDNGFQINDDPLIQRLRLLADATLDTNQSLEAYIQLRKQINTEPVGESKGQTYAVLFSDKLKNYQEINDPWSGTRHGDVITEIERGQFIDPTYDKDRTNITDAQYWRWLVYNDVASMGANVGTQFGKQYLAEYIPNIRTKEELDKLEKQYYDQLGAWTDIAVSQPEPITLKQFQTGDWIPEQQPAYGQQAMNKARDIVGSAFENYRKVLENNSLFPDYLEKTGMVLPGMTQPGFADRYLASQIAAYPTEIEAWKAIEEEYQRLSAQRFASANLQSLYTGFLNQAFPWFVKPKPTDGLELKTEDGSIYKYNASTNQVEIIHNAVDDDKPSVMPWESFIQANPNMAPTNEAYTPSPTVINQEGLGSSYSQSSASPRQVIVNIDSLMNVDSVDMSAPGVESVLDDLRSRMAEVLMGVVSDFSNSMQYNN